MHAERLPENEEERLAALLAHGVLDSAPEQAFDDLTQIASETCGAPIALVSLVDAERQWFTSRVGLGATETPREVAFCSHAILEPNEVLVVPDSFEDERFHDNPLATGAPDVRFYAGAPLVTSAGLPMGTLCVIDSVPREITEQRIETLQALSRQVVSQLELRKTNTQLRELAHEVQNKNEELEQFTSIAAHDPREPLRKLVAFTALPKDDLGEELPERADEDLGFIVDTTKRMDRLVCSLLELSCSGSAELEVEHVALEDCVSIARDVFRSRIDEGNVHFEVDLLPTVQGDQTLLNQVFQNLIGNALKFTQSEAPRIHITCTNETGELVVGVKDNGIGMEPQYAESIFEPFKRLHDRQDYDGAGIGLPITRKVVERHGGRIWAESSPGGGSHFRFTLKGMRLPSSLSRPA